MPPKTINEIRSRYIGFFEEHGHRFVTSANLVPDNDDTLMFTNAGMVQFKDALLGLEKRPYSRAVTSQKCLRVSGKHNDLDEVGPSPRHHTFFEMLGNFSFGDYFKEQAIQFAWQLLVEDWELPLDRLWFSVYEEDDEAVDLWRAVGAPRERILPFDRKDNWWSMGETGPCGPCSEIHYYWGDMRHQHADGVNRDDEYLEFWNLVFMQYDQVTATQLEPLPRPGVDTGAGLERVASILQDTDNNYDTDGFLYLMDLVQELAGQTDARRQENLVAYRVIADHARAVTFLIADGVLPGNEGRNYITRLILRRAARFGRTLGFTDPFMAEVAQGVIRGMGDHFQEIRQREELIRATITAEESRFRQTLTTGLGHLEDMVRQNRNQGQAQVSGSQAFLLWDTFGFPVDLTRDLAREEGMTVAEAEFQELAAQARERSRQAAAVVNPVQEALYGKVLQTLQTAGKLEPGGVQHSLYESDWEADRETRVLALVKDGEIVESADAGDAVEAITAATPFYVESGGQVSDNGWLHSERGRMAVTDMRRPVAGLIVHAGSVTEGRLQTGDSVRCPIDGERRKAIQRNHTATHLLHAHLRRRLGPAVHQAGSMVAPERLRFDFTFDRALTPQEVRAVQTDLQNSILADSPVTASWKGYAEAVSSGAMALFGEKYDETVRVVRIGDEEAVSQELCGGMHVSSTAELGSLFIVSEGSSAAGQRRIEAVTGTAANLHAATVFDRLARSADLLRTQPDMMEQSIESLLEQNAQLRRDIRENQRAQIRDRIEVLLAGSRDVAQVPCVLDTVPAQDLDMMRELSDMLQDRLDQGVVALGADIGGKPMLVVSVASRLADRGLHAGTLVKEAASHIGGGGGGRQNIAQAGGRRMEGLPAALNAVEGAVARQLQAAP